MSVPSPEPWPWRVHVATLALTNVEAAGRSATRVTPVAVADPRVAIVAV